MIEKLTIDRLLAYGFIAEDIAHFREWDNFEVMFHKTLNLRYWASNIEKKIYSGIDASRKYYLNNKSHQLIFPRDEMDLIPEYFELKRNQYLENRKKLAGIVYNEIRSRERFKELEIETTATAIELAKKTFEHPNSAVDKLAAKFYREEMEIYLDWLSELVEPPPAPVLRPSVIKYFKAIPQINYSQIHINNEETMAFYEERLKNANSDLSLTSTVFDLPAVYKITERWNSILADRLQKAPSKTLAKEAFHDELLQTIIYDDDADSNDPFNKERYLNRYRKIAYNFVIKGQAVTLRYLGYLILKYLCGQPEGFEIIENIIAVPNVGMIVEGFAEGAAVALFLHEEKIEKTKEGESTVLFKDGYEPGIYLNLLKNPTFKILSDTGEYIYGQRKKSYVTVFFDVLQKNGIVNHFNAKARAVLINNLIPNLKTTGRTLQGTNDKANAMASYFQSLINSL